jgi:hypothetical protein
LPGSIAAGSTVPWSQITSKPTAFVPTTHQHSWTDITNEPATYPPSTHSHSYAAVSHAHDYAPNPHSNAAHVGDGFAPWSHDHGWASITGKPTTFTPTDHTNSRHSVAYFPVAGGVFTGGVTADDFYMNSANTRYNGGRKDSDGGQPTMRIYYSGTKWIWEHSSSAKWKRDVEDVDLADVLHKLRPRKFTSMGGASLEEAVPGRRTFGLVAEEVAEVLPEVCAFDEEGNAGYVAYDMLSVVALSACQDLDRRLRALEESKRG